MTKTKAQKDESPRIEITPTKRGHATLFIVGRTPFVFNAVSEKAKRELLLPRGRKTAAEKHG